MHRARRVCHRYVMKSVRTAASEHGKKGLHLGEPLPRANPLVPPIPLNPTCPAVPHSIPPIPLNPTYPGASPRIPPRSCARLSHTGRTMPRSPLIGFRDAEEPVGIDAEGLAGLDQGGG